MLLVCIALALVSVASTAYLWRRNRRLKRESEDWARIARLGKDTNYQLSCMAFGKAEVDRAIREATSKGGT